MAETDINAKSIGRGAESIGRSENLNGRGAKSKRRASNFPALAASLTALAASVWIIAPAPSYSVWLFSVAASEWSFVIALIAVCATAAALLFGTRRKIRAATILTGALALSFALYPFFSALAAARKHDVSLSIREYAAGFFGRGAGGAAETFEFAEVDGNSLRLDVYTPPSNVPKNGASIVVVHGGAWNAGGRGDFPQWNVWLASAGYTIFDVDYRLAPQPNSLTATGDVKCAVLWVKRNAARFGVAPDKIVLLGRSAGAHLALLSAYTAGDARFPASCPNANGEGRGADSGAPLDETARAVVSFYAPTDLLWDFDNPANESVIDGKKTLAQFVGGNPHESGEMNERFAAASPTARVRRQTPPTLLIHGGQDQLVRRENMDLLGARLAAANVRHETIFIGYAQHGFDYNFNGWGAQIVKPVLLDFLRDNTK